MVVVIISHAAEHCVKHSFAALGLSSKPGIGGTYRQHEYPHYAKSFAVKASKPEPVLATTMWRTLTELEQSQKAYNHERPIALHKHSDSTGKEK